MNAFLQPLNPVKAPHCGAPIDTLPRLPRDAQGPVFREPWEAQAFAMCLALYERGLFTLGRMGRCPEPPDPAGAGRW